MRLIVIAACTVVTMGAQTAAPAPAASPMATTQPAVKAPSAMPSSSSAPIDAHIVLGLTYVRGSINGSRPLDVVLDSGAGVSVVTPQLAEELQLKTGETTAAAGPGKGGDNLLHMLPNATLKLGGTTIADQTIAALPIDYIAQQSGVPTEGIFGGNFFTPLVVDEDYAAHTVRLLGSATFTPPAGFVSVPVDMGGNVAFTQLDFQAPDGSKLSGVFVIDSGTVGDLIFAEPFVKAHPALLSGKRVDLPSVTAVGGNLQLQAGRIPRSPWAPSFSKSRSPTLSRSSFGANHILRPSCVRSFLPWCAPRLHVSRITCRTEPLQCPVRTSSSDPRGPRSCLSNWTT